MQAEKSDKRAQTVVSICVLLVLAGIAVGLLITHARYDRGAKEAQPVALIKAGSPLVAPLPAGLVVKTAPERFDRQTLSDKIDGRADYYLPSGFIALTCQRFALAGDPGAWLEMYVYDMGADDNAFAVFTAQRRPTGEPLELTQHSYHAGGSTFFTHGQYYVEIVSPGPSEQLAEAGMALARTFVAETRIDTASQLDAAGLFPPDGLVPDSITLKKADVFGFDGLDNVYTATYYYPFVHKEIYATAYVSPRASADKAKQLAEAYEQFLRELGAGEVRVSGELPAGMTVLELSGYYYVIFHRGQFMAGVNECKDIRAARLAADLLDRHLSELAE